MRLAAAISGRPGLSARAQIFSSSAEYRRAAAVAAGGGGFRRAGDRAKAIRFLLQRRVESVDRPGKIERVQQCDRAVEIGCAGALQDV